MTRPRPPRTVTWCPVSGFWPDAGSGVCGEPHVTFDLVPRGGAAVVRATMRYDAEPSWPNKRKLDAAVGSLRAKKTRRKGR